MVNRIGRLNLNNLTSLWQRMGVPSFVAQCSPSHHLYLATAWPHRCWLEISDKTVEASVRAEFISRLPSEYVSQAVSQNVSQTVPQAIPQAIVPVWDYPQENALAVEQELIKQGMVVSFTQTAMYLDIQKPIISVDKRAVDIRISRLTVDMQDDIQTWVAVASEAFGYAIDPLVIRSIANDPDIFLLLATKNGEAVATAMLFRSSDDLQENTNNNKNIVGIHQMGVPTRHAGQGIAAAVMDYIIHYCQQSGDHYLTLQASVAGEGLYRRLGFIPQFGIRNYHFPQE
jgi:GNAT superfamily N-acetyltransferase